MFIEIIEIPIHIFAFMAFFGGEKLIIVNGKFHKNDFFLNRPLQTVNLGSSFFDG